MKHMNLQRFHNKATAIKTAVATGALALSVNANAALDDAIKNAINGGFSNANEAAGLVIVGIVGIFAIMLIKRVIK